MKDEDWPKKVTSYQIDGRQPRGRPCTRLSDVVSADMKALNLSVKDASDRAAWRNAIKPGTASENKRIKKIQPYKGVLPTYVDRWT